jgi:hypothetical protein
VPTVRWTRGHGLIRATPVRSTPPIAARFFSGSGGWIGSCVLHALLPALAVMLGFMTLEPKTDPYVPLVIDVAPEEQQHVLDELKRGDVFKKMAEKDKREANIAQQVEFPAVVPEPRVEELDPGIRAVKDPRIPEPAPNLDISLTAPTEIFSVPASPSAIGVGSGRRPTRCSFVPGITNGLGSGIYALRTDAKTRLKAAKRFGGGEDTENAVELALAWLAKQQNADGSWEFKSGPQASWLSRCADHYKTGVTGLVTLAFLGAGHSHRHGKHKKTVSKALGWLINNQKKYGGWTKKPRDQEMHAQGIATLALVEACSLCPEDSENGELLKHAQRGVNFIHRAQFPYSGWSYHMCPRPLKGGVALPALKARDRAGATISRRARMIEQSVVAWNGMALKAAKTTGLRVDGKALAGMVKWLDDAQGLKGHYAYSGTMKIDGAMVAFCNKRSPPGMVAAALMMRFWTGHHPDSRNIQASADLVLKHLKRNWRRWARESRSDSSITMSGCYVATRPKRIPPDLYFLHHGTLAMFQIGGKRWKRWNAMTKKVVLENQEKNGHWTVGGYCLMGSDTMATAFGALILESYYRYSPLYSREVGR